MTTSLLTYLGLSPVLGTHHSFQQAPHPQSLPAVHMISSGLGETIGHQCPLYPEAGLLYKPVLTQANRGLSCFYIFNHTHLLCSQFIILHLLHFTVTSTVGPTTTCAAAPGLPISVNIPPMFAPLTIFYLYFLFLFYFVTLA